MKTKNQMIDFITSFDLYPTMNSWNNSEGYSINVKLHGLDLTSKQKDTMYEILADEGLSEEYYMALQDVITEHEIKINEAYRETRYDPLNHISEEEKKNPYSMIRQFEIGFNGRSGGHLVLYKWNGYNYAGTGWHFDQDELMAMSKPELTEVYTVLRGFYNCFLELLKVTRSYGNMTIKEEVTSTVSYKTLTS